jgi:hypothetical protein
MGCTTHAGLGKQQQQQQLHPACLPQLELGQTNRQQALVCA